MPTKVVVMRVNVRKDCRCRNTCYLLYYYEQKCISCFARSELDTHNESIFA